MGEVLRLVTGDVGGGVKIAPNAVLAGARKARLTGVVVIGYEPDGALYFASTDGPAETLWALEEAKQALFSD